MENRTFVLRNIRRYLDFPMPIDTIGFRPKNTWIHRHQRIRHYFLCFVLKNEIPESVVKINDQTQLFGTAPYMSLLKPGTVLDSCQANCREEIFFVYQPEAGKTLDLFNLHSCNFKITPSFNDTLQRIKNNFDCLQCPGVADRMDCLALELACEAIIAASEPNPGKAEFPDERIFLIANYFQIHYSDRICLDELLKKHNITRRTFYREWNKYYSVTPTQYLIELRLKHACEELSHSRKKIYEIAFESGFSDPMYFNHCFTQHFGCSPLDFRQKGETADKSMQKI